MYLKIEDKKSEIVNAHYIPDFTVCIILMRLIKKLHFMYTFKNYVLFSIIYIYVLNYACNYYFLNNFTKRICGF